MSRAGLWGYQAGWALVRRAPESPTRLLFDLGAELAARRGGRGTQRLKGNLARVSGLAGRELDDLVRAGLRSYARYWLEVFRLPAMTPREVVERWQWQGVDVLRDAHAAGRGVVLALSHSGNWDAAGVWLVDTIGPFTTVAERLEPAELFDEFVRFRESLGMEVLAHRGGEQPPFETLVQRLSGSGRVVCLLADRDLSTSGVDVEFCGGRISMAAGPAALALRTGAPLLPVTLWFTESGWGGVVHPAIPATDVTGMTQGLADVFAASIREHPQDWHMLGKVFTG